MKHPSCPTLQPDPPLTTFGESQFKMKNEMDSDHDEPGSGPFVPKTGAYETLREKCQEACINLIREQNQYTDTGWMLVRLIAQYEVFAREYTTTEGHSDAQYAETLLASLITAMMIMRKSLPSSPLADEHDDCGDPNCSIHGKGGLLSILKSLVSLPTKDILSSIPGAIVVDVTKDGIKVTTGKKKPTNPYDDATDGPQHAN